jgi:hypothetical protein
MRHAIPLTLLLSLSFAAIAHDGPAGGHEREPAAAVPVQRTEAGAVYGAALPAEPVAAVSLDEAAADVAGPAGKTGAYRGRITQVCQKMGCWLVLAGDSGGFARVFMHDHAFSVPKDARGQAIVYGTLGEKAFPPGKSRIWRRTAQSRRPHANCRSTRPRC